ncbi:response regulator [Aquihabitans daechungensis]|uniref:response regulator n=1 Tax=Aquihabitans daechungensis TaxID=1052257 RepID=UPI003BA1498D
MPSRILFVEDDPAIRAQTLALLADEGYETDEAPTAKEGLAIFERRPADCVLLDVMLPDLDGFEVCRRLRAQSDVPIIMVTARSDSFDVVAGLEAGADDYVSKPFVPKELSARIRAMLRRTQGSSPTSSALLLGDRVEVVPEEGIVRVDGEEVHLTRTEFRLLCELGAAPGRVFTRELLLESVWGYEYVGDTKLVDMHVYRLRSKIESNPSDPEVLLTVRGLGYKVAGQG